MRESEFKILVRNIGYVNTSNYLKNLHDFWRLVGEPGMIPDAGKNNKG